MLVITRRPGESVNCYSADGSVVTTVTVLHIGGGQVKLGLAAPPSVAILRDEIDWRRKAAPAGGRP